MNEDIKTLSQRLLDLKISQDIETKRLNHLIDGLFKLLEDQENRLVNLEKAQEIIVDIEDKEK